MPVSHLGLTVSRIADATSFYLSALQPLGYRYVGQQGDAVGLGVNDADFFLCQTKNGARVAPNHIAFAANDRLTVRDCYTAALNAGGRPSGPPGYRNNDCSCFNAAVEDLDGNTIEFIFRETSGPTDAKRIQATSESSTTSAHQGDAAPNASRDGGQSFASFASKAQSRAQTALKVASSAAKSMRTSDAPTPGISRSSTEPVGSMNQNGGNAIVGTLLGAAAGAAFAYAMTKSERESARDEADFATSMQSRNRRARTSPENSTGSRDSDRNRSRMESGRGSRYMPRTIEAPPYDDYEIQDVLTRHRKSSRPTPQRSRTYDAIEHAPKPSSNGRDNRLSIKRASTMPLDIENYYIEAPGSKSTSRYGTRRGSFDDSKLKRHDSGVSMNSHRSRRSSSGHMGKPRSSRRSSWHESAAQVPLPPSRTTSYITAGQQSARASKTPSYATAAQVPLPQSRATSYISAAQVPIPTSNHAAGYTDVGEESDGLGDMLPVMPDDSISCVDFSKPKNMTKPSNKRSTSSSKRSEVDSERTVRPAKHSSSKYSARTLPTRRKENYSERRGKRSTATYA